MERRRIYDEEPIPEDIVLEEDPEYEPDEMIVSQGHSEVGSIQHLVDEGRRRFHDDESIEMQRSVNLDGFPNVDFYYKLVAKIGGSLYSIYDAGTEYKTGEVLSQPARPGHRGGYYVYASVQDAIFADVPYKAGGNFIAPRTVLKCICWGDFVIYSNGKMSFSHLMPVADLGLPRGYKANKEAIRRALMEQNGWRQEELEREYNLNMVRRNREPDQYSMSFSESNLFENYFSASAVAEIERLIAGEQEEARQARRRLEGDGLEDQQQPAAAQRQQNEDQPISRSAAMRNEIRDGLSSEIAAIEARYR